MRETNFISQNKKKWEEFEQMLKVQDKDPDKLSELFIQITDDLSYAKTFYPNRSVRFYLNNLGQQIFYNLYKGRKKGLKNFKKFWTYNLPRVVYESRKELLLSLIIFILSAAIGIFSTIKDPSFPKFILGGNYINMTIENIENGDPMAVYKKMNQTDMFMGITYNNLLVAFRTFIMGVFLAIGTIVMMMYNGIMLGTFQYFFYERGLFWESFLTIWLHGTLEISSIIIAGGAGLKLGSGMIFPGTYTRMQAFKLSARKGLILMMGTVPIFIVAAIIKSFVTRYTEVHFLLKAGLILASLFFIISYFIILPLRKARKGHFLNHDEERLPQSQATNIDFENIKSNGETFSSIFIIYQKLFSKILLRVLTSSIIYSTIVSYLLNYTLPTQLDYNKWMFYFLKIIPFNFFIINLFEYSSEYGIVLFLVNTVALGLNLFFIGQLLTKEINSEIPLFKKGNPFTFLFNSLMISLLINFIFFLPFGVILLILITLIPTILLWHFISFQEKNGLPKALSKTFDLLKGGYGRLTGLCAILLVAGFIYYFLIASPLTYIYLQFINWNINLDENEQRLLYIAFYTLISFVGYSLILPILPIGFGLSYFSIREAKEAVRLKERIMNFGTKSNNAK